MCIRDSFSIEQRVRMVEGALAHLENVEIVTSTQELAVTVARNLGVITLILSLIHILRQEVYDVRKQCLSTV